MTKLREAANELAAALRSCRGAFVGTTILSGLINILMLTGSFYSFPAEACRPSSG
jgi:ABC-type protease/lipase transport system fused ATPase/permease subunit